MVNVCALMLRLMFGNYVSESEMLGVFGPVQY
jgi:hypothetical protein